MSNADERDDAKAKMSTRIYFDNAGAGLGLGASRDFRKAEFARRLQSFRVSKGWDLTELARRAAKCTAAGTFSRNSLSDYERGRAFPQAHRLVALAQALGVEPTDLAPTASCSRAPENLVPIAFNDMGDGQAWLTVNMQVTFETAVEIIRLLNKDRTNASD